MKAWLAPLEIESAAGLVGADSFSMLGLREGPAFVVGTLEAARTVEGGLLLLLLAAVDGMVDWAETFGFAGAVASGFDAAGSGSGADVVAGAFFLKLGNLIGGLLTEVGSVNAGGPSTATGDEGLNFFGGSWVVGSELLRFLSPSTSAAALRQSIAPRSSAAWRTDAER